MITRRGYSASTETGRSGERGLKRFHYRRTVRPSGFQHFFETSCERLPEINFIFFGNNTWVLIKLIRRTPFQRLAKSKIHATLARIGPDCTYCD